MNMLNKVKNYNNNSLNTFIYEKLEDSNW